jgi:acetylornithine/N-succinyldiaminopimelate aminotransferase
MNMNGVMLMKNTELVKTGQEVIMKNVGRLPVVFAGASGSRLWDADGKEYIDFLTGISVHNFGHCHPEITAAIAKQAGKITHVSNYFYLEEQVELARRLTKLTGYRQVFFSNSGAEANEAALKLARKYGKTKLGGKFEIIAAKDSFHGRTYGALSATGQPRYQENFLPIVPGFTYAEYNQLQSWRDAVTDRTCAIFLELVQGEGGVTPARPEFIAGLRQLCEERNLLLMVDEVQTGLGRTGKMFAYEHYDFQPDLITIAKTLGGGVPCGALLVNSKANVFTPGDHSTTVGGGALAFAAGLAVLDLLQAPGLLDEVNRKGEYLQKVWQSWRTELPVIRGSRGLGLMLALELTVPSKQVMLACLEAGLVVNAVTATALRFLPAFNITQDELDEGLGILKEVLKQF